MICALRATARLTVLVAVGLAGVAAGASPSVAQLVRSGTGTTAASITPARDAFRTDLGGGLVAGANGLFSDATGARREINWDGVPDAFAAPSNLPANFFNVNSPRGVVFSTAGTAFQVSANAGVTTVEFGNIDASYPNVFAPFSAQRLFTALGSNVVDVTFFVPGTATPAVVKGFGAVFSDVDLANTTSIQFFNSSNASLGSFFVPATVGSEAFSFLGVSFPTRVVARVRITSGNIALGPSILDQNGDLNDLVVMDDFIYGEPSVTSAVTFASFSGHRTRRGVVLRWRTAQEVGSLGFNVYRRAAGHRLRLNRRILPARRSVGGARYLYRDTRAPRYGRLRYWLQEVGTDGSRRWHGPLVVSA
jgi:hypothetical protein